MSRVTGPDEECPLVASFMEVAAPRWDTSSLLKGLSAPLDRGAPAASKWKDVDCNYIWACGCNQNVHTHILLPSFMLCGPKNVKGIVAQVIQGQTVYLVHLSVYLASQQANCDFISTCLYATDPDTCVANNSSRNKPLVTIDPQYTPHFLFVHLYKSVLAWASEASPLTFKLSTLFMLNQMSYLFFEPITQGTTG